MKIFVLQSSGECQMHDNTSENTYAVHKTKSRVSLNGRVRSDFHETSDIKVPTTCTTSLRASTIQKEHHGIYMKSIWSLVYLYSAELHPGAERQCARLA